MLKISTVKAKMKRELGTHRHGQRSSTSSTLRSLSTAKSSRPIYLKDGTRWSTQKFLGGQSSEALQKLSTYMTHCYSSYAATNRGGHDSVFSARVGLKLKKYRKPKLLIKTEFVFKRYQDATLAAERLIQQRSSLDPS